MARLDEERGPFCRPGDRRVIKRENGVGWVGPGETCDVLDRRAAVREVGGETHIFLQY